MKEIKLTIGSMTVTLQPRAFESGKIGYGFYGKIFAEDGTQLQTSVSLVIPHSENSVTDEAKNLRKALAAANAAKAARKAGK